MKTNQNKKDTILIFFSNKKMEKKSETNKENKAAAWNSDMIHVVARTHTQNGREHLYMRCERRCGGIPGEGNDPPGPRGAACGFNDYFFFSSSPLVFLFLLLLCLFSPAVLRVPFVDRRAGPQCKKKNATLNRETVLIIIIIIVVIIIIIVTLTKQS